MTCQNHKDKRTRPFGDPQTIPLPDRRWGYVSMYFITHLPMDDRLYNLITTVVDLLSLRVLFIASKDTDSAADTEAAVATKYSSLTVCFIQ